jgi:hypothetical protein
MPGIRSAGAERTDAATRRGRDPEGLVNKLNAAWRCLVNSPNRGFVISMGTDRQFERRIRIVRRILLSSNIIGIQFS